MTSLISGSNVGGPSKTARRSYLVVGCRTVSRDHAEWISLAMLNFALAETSFFGRLSKTLRDRLQVIDELDVALTSGKLGGHWLFRARTLEKQTERLIQAVKEELLHLETERLPRGEVNIIRREMARSYQIMLSTNTLAVELIHELEFYGVGFQSLNKFLAEVESTRPEQIHEIAKRYFSASKMTVLSSSIENG